MNKIVFSLLIIVIVITFSCSEKKALETEIQYLSGTGFGNTLEWDFYCTDGRKSGEWAKIQVPSHWEQQGFGTYNYGYDPRNKMAQEKGIYKTSFSFLQAGKRKK